MTILSDRYNGWTNYATWRVNLEIFDGIDPRDMDWHKLDWYDLGYALRDYATEILEMESSHKGTHVSMVLSYALAFLEDVNWHEIGEAMIEAYADEDETEQCE